VPQTLRVHLLPALVAPEMLAGRTAVVIDVLRATTTIVTALAAGAREVVPCLEVEEALQLAANSPNDCVLGGERGGLRIEGFRLGNSPAEYLPEAVADKRVIFTTTNGTRAMIHCRQAHRVLIAAFVNFSATCRELASQPHIDIVCAGTDGNVTREDTLLAGAIVDDLVSGANGPTDDRSTPAFELNDQAEIASDAWRAAIGQLTGKSLLASEMRRSLGARNLIEIGQEHDIDLASQLDRYDLLVELNLREWAIHAS
jgi:2-phosphosulfolactate phosphatase